jgi:hypothetical protein
MKKDGFKKEIANVEAYASAISDLMSTTIASRFVQTLEGAVDNYAERMKCNRMEAALWWMTDNYDNISAEVRAAMYLSDAVQKMAMRLWDNANAILPDD